MPVTSSIETVFKHENEGRAAAGHSSGVSWGAVIGGAFVAAAFYLILLALGAGFELSSASLWSNVDPAASTVGAAAIVWLILIEVISSGLGGYLTGRLRTKWTLVHTDEVYFRDTANGFLAWAVALIISVTLLASAATSMAGHVAQAVLDPPAGTAGGAGRLDYFVDMLFRSDRRLSESEGAVARAQAGRVLANTLRQTRMPAADESYLAHMVSDATGLSGPEAEQRLSEVVAEARQAEDTARKATAHLLLWSFLSLLMGALSASYAATIGGRQRDHLPAV